MKNNYKNEEIDLIEILHNIWNCKFKIILSTLIAIMVAYLYHGTAKPTFTATTEVKPISTFEEFNYHAYNLYSIKINKEMEIDPVDEVTGEVTGSRRIINFNRIDKDYLLILLIDKIKEGKIINDAIKKLDLIDRKNYDNEKEYEDAITELTSSIVVIPPITDEDTNISTHWKIVADIKDIKQWNKFLKYINKTLSESVQIYLADNLKKKILNEKKFVEFKFNDIDQKISNSLINYEMVISARLAFLEEQAKIARSLNIARNKLIEEQSFETDSGMITTLRAKIPYYMRGYEMIEKEIELTQGRTDVNLFIPEIILLEKEKNALKINILDKIKRMENLIKQTPIVGNNNFSAGRVSYSTTRYESNKSPLSTVLILTALIGFILSTLYFLLEDAIKKRL